MTLKRKIQCGAGLFVVALLVIVLWPAEEQPLPRIWFSGVSEFDSNRVLFAISNASGTRVSYSMLPLQYQSNYWIPAFGLGGMTGFSIDGHSTSNHGAFVPTTNRWRIGLSWNTGGTAYNSLAPWRQKLWKFTLDHGGPRLSKWVWKGETFMGLDGPEMLGNQPVPVDL